MRTTRFRYIAHDLSCTSGYSKAIKKRPKINAENCITGNLTISVIKIADWGVGLVMGLTRRIWKYDSLAHCKPPGLRRIPPTKSQANLR